MKIFTNVVLVVLAGASLGFLMGLSLSPVIQIVVTSIMTTIGSLLAIFAGVNNSPSSEPNSSTSEAAKINVSAPPSYFARFANINLFPFAFLILALAGGACIGIHARTNEWFGTNPDAFAAKWHNTKLKPEVIEKRLFDNLYPNGEADSSNKSEPGLKGNGKGGTAPGLSAGLFAINSNDCQMIQLKHGKELEANLKLLDDSIVNSLLARCNSDSCLELIKTIVCKK